MRCDHCFSEQITFFRQYRKDGVVTVTARCINGHSPKKGHPFYPLSNFKDVKALPVLPGQKEPAAPEKQMSFIPETTTPKTKVKQFQDFRTMFPRLERK